MKIFEVSLRSVEDVQDFVSLACGQPFELTVGDYRNYVNAKSFMQIFCLNLSGRLEVRMDCTEEEFWRFFEAAEHFRN